MIAGGHLFPVYGLGNECAERYFLKKKDVRTEIPLGLNKVYVCHTDATRIIFLAK